MIITAKRSPGVHPICSNVIPSQGGYQPKRITLLSAGNSDTAVDVDKVVKDLADRWDKIDDKTSVVLYGSGSLVLLWFSSAIVGAVNNIPLLPKLMEIVGLSYTAWFTYRYLLFKTSRQQLVQDIEELQKKISGEQ